MTTTSATESFLRTAGQCGIAHNGGAGGQYLLAATSGQLQKLVERLAQDTARYQLLRRGQKWSVVDGIGTVLRAETLDAAIDNAMAKD